MSDDSRVRDRVALWQRWWASGRDLPPEDLCRDCPELLERITAEIDALRSLGDTAFGVPTPPGIATESLTDAGEPSASGVGSAWGRLVVPAVDQPPEKIGDYRVLQVLGRGGMGTVYLAEDVRLGRLAAVKMMRSVAGTDATARARFLREARAAARLSHDHVIPIWQVGETPEGLPFIAMPALSGETLESRLRRESVVPLGLLLKVAREVAEGLAAAHAAGLVHRDVKPANVWLEAGADGKPKRCKILDFGLVREIELGDQRLTASGTIQGTPSYIAPEQAHGERADHRSDLFSLGVVLYRMATGELPFRGTNIMAVIYAVTTHNPPSARSRNPNLPEGVSVLIGRMLSKDPAARPRSASDVAAEARRLGKAIRERRAAPPFRPPPPPAMSLARSPAEESASGVYPWELHAARVALRPGLPGAPGAPPTRPVPEPVSGALIVALGLVGLAAVGAVLAGAVAEAPPTQPAKPPYSGRR